MTRLTCSPRWCATIGLSLLVFLDGCGAEVVTPENAKQRLIFQVGTPDTAIGEETLDKAYQAIQRRLLSTHDFTTETIVEKKPPNQIVVSIRNLTPEKVQSLQRIVTRPGGMQFALLANPVDHAQLIAAAEKSAAPNEDAETMWIPVAKDSRGKPRDLGNDSSLVIRQVEKNGETVQEALVIPGRPNMRITEEYLKQASIGLSETGHCINFVLTDRGGYLMQDLTSRNQPTPDGVYRRLAIILEGSVQVAPTINAPIGATGQITGDFTEQDLEELIIALNGGRLPAPVQFVESQPVGDKD